MEKEILFQMKSPYRDDFKIYGYRFGKGKKTMAIVGALRGDEIQQQYTSALLVKRFAELEQSGALLPDCEVLIIPSVNPSSMNIGKRFWSMDNTDINRMFPGYSKGETTQRIAAAIFEKVKDYKYGIQLASYYIPGEFIPHVRMLNTGFHPEKEAAYFGLPYIYIREVTPYDTTLLNYNWQIWETKAFSVYTGLTDKLEDSSAEIALQSIVRFMDKMNIINAPVRPGYHSQVISNASLVTVTSKTSGLLRKLKSAQEYVSKGDLLAEVIDPYDATVREQITAPVNGVLFFAQENPLLVEGARAFEIVAE
ncbi:MAG: M14 family metallopeptidase [Bacteroidales bacterium]